MNELPKDLIEASLALTGKTMEDMTLEIFKGLCFNQFGDFNGPDCEVRFSYEYFFTYLLSPEFIEKYAIYHLEMGVSGFSDQEASLFRFSKAIYEYQKGNPEPLIELLNKI